MTKFICDRSNCESLINSSLDNCINNLKNISTVFSQITIPQDFKYKTYLIQMSESTSSQINDMNALNRKMRDSYKELSNVNEELMRDISSIENYNISLRQSAIK